MSDVFPPIENSSHVGVQPDCGSYAGIGKELDHSVYECVYLATTEKQCAPLITPDRRFYNRVKNQSLFRIDFVD